MALIPVLYPPDFGGTAFVLALPNTYLILP